MKINRIATILFLFAALNDLYSQVTFENYYYTGSSNINNSAVSVTECADSGFIFLGQAIQNNSYIHIAKTNSSGNLQWSKVFGLTGSEGYPAKVLETRDGGFAFLGSAFYNLINNETIIFGKFDANGNSLWTKIFSGAGSISNTAYDFKQTSDSGFIIVGTGVDTSGKLMLIKTNADGDSLWTKKYDCPNIAGTSVCQTPDGGYLITGNLHYNDGDILLMKIDPFGTIEWNKYFHHNNDVIITKSIEPAGDSTYLLSLWCYNLIPTQIFYSALLKVNSIGDTIWTRRLPKYRIESKANINTGNISVVMDSALLYLDMNGNLIWSKLFQENFYTINNTHDGGFILCGSFQPGGSNNYYSCLIKTDSLGNSACSTNAMNFSMENYPVTSSSDTINMFPGLSYVNTSLDSLMQMHEFNICSSTGIDEVLGKKNLYVFPNPATTKLFITLENQTGTGQISLYNMIGQICLRKDVFNVSSFEIDVSTFEKGVYLLRIDSRDQSFYSKVIIE